MDHEVSFPVLDGTKIRMFRGGNGEAAIFLHGGAGLGAWTPFFQKVVEGSYDLRVPEHPGFGQSDNPEWLNSVADLALFYLNFLDTIDARKVHLIANSFGGWIAAELASRDCSRLNSLTLIGPSGLLPKAGAKDIFRWSHEENTRNLFYNQAIADRMLSASPTVDQLATQIKNQTTVVRLGAKYLNTNPDLGRWLQRIKAPTHIIWGEHDKLQPVAIANEWAALIPNAKVTIVSGAGHLPHAEKPEFVGSAVVDFLKSVH